ncbi:hypothetical protein COLO4_28194 [Corchorus olitorius]|uniref:Uncharacterized protein n=1 Tax=Corchorus olitorius TaxID=93759 RepID=A0A1R3HMJ0_9ROSI|nr:hypothetical protein COLO4_28194 [Corchorus olitorius]
MALFRTKVAFTAWTIWKGRCESVFQHKAVNPSQIVKRSQYAVWNFIKITTKFSGTSKANPQPKKASEVGYESGCGSGPG